MSFDFLSRFWALLFTGVLFFTLERIHRSDSPMAYALIGAACVIGVAYLLKRNN